MAMEVDKDCPLQAATDSTETKLKSGKMRSNRNGDSIEYVWFLIQTIFREWGSQRAVGKVLSVPDWVMAVNDHGVENAANSSITFNSINNLSWWMDETQCEGYKIHDTPGVRIWWSCKVSAKSKEPKERSLFEVSQPLTADCLSWLLHTKTMRRVVWKWWLQLFPVVVKPWFKVCSL